MCPFISFRTCYNKSDWKTDPVQPPEPARRFGGTAELNLAEYLEKEEGPQRAELGALMASYPAGAPVYPVRLGAGELLIREGDPCSMVRVLLRGRVSVIVNQPRFSSLTVTEFGPPEFFGEYELLAGRDRYLADVRTLAASRFLALPAESYLLWARQDPDFFFGRVRSILGALLYQTENERTRHFLDAAGRVMQVLIRACERGEPAEPLRLTATRAEIAEQTGCSVRTVNRVVRELAGRELVSVEGGKLRLSSGQVQALKREFGLQLQ